MTRYERIGAKAIASALAHTVAPVLFFRLACVADVAARAAGKRRDLHESLYNYEPLLPASHCTRWLTPGGGNSDSLLMVVRKDWKPGTDKSTSLLLGPGILEYLN